MEIENTKLFSDGSPPNKTLCCVYRFNSQLNTYFDQLKCVYQNGRWERCDLSIAPHPKDRYSIPRDPNEIAKEERMHLEEYYNNETGEGWIPLNPDKLKYCLIKTIINHDDGSLLEGVTVYPNAYSAMVASRSTLVAKVKYEWILKPEKKPYGSEDVALANWCTITDIRECYPAVNKLAAEILGEFYNDGTWGKIYGKGVDIMALAAPLYTECDLYMPPHYVEKLPVDYQLLLLPIHAEFKYFLVQFNFDKLCRRIDGDVTTWGIYLLEKIAKHNQHDRIIRDLEKLTSCPLSTFTRDEILNFAKEVQSSFKSYFGVGEPDGYVSPEGY